MGFIVLSALLGPMISAGVGVLVVKTVLGGESYWFTWVARWNGNDSCY